MKNRTLSLSWTVIIVFCITCLSKCVGFIRNTVIASYFGATAATDAYFFASSMPTLIFPTLCTAVSVAFLSLYAEKCTTESKENAKEFASISITAASVFAIGLSILGMTLAPVLTRVFAPGFQGETLSLAVKATLILMPTFVCNMCIYMINAVLDTHKKHIVPQSIGLVSNIVIILGIIAGSTHYGIYSLIFSQLAGTVLQVVFVWSFAHRYFSFGGPKAIASRQFRRILKLSVPIILGNSLGQINQIVDKVIVSLFQDGSMSSLSYATTLCDVVDAMMVVPVLSILYPRLAEQHSLNNQAGTQKLLKSALSFLTIGLVPIMLFLSCFADYVVAFVYQRGEFNEAAVNSTSNMLRIYSWGLIGFGIRELYTKYFYARKDMKTPMKTSSFSIVVNIVLSIALSSVCGISGIAIATTISLGVGALLIVVQYYRHCDQRIEPNTLFNWGKVIGCGTATYALAVSARKIFVFESLLLNILMGGVLILAVYVALLLLLRYEPLKQLLKEYAHRRKQRHNAGEGMV